MDATTFRASAAAIEPYLRALATGAEGCRMGRLRVIGREAEAAMLAATGGINTHRGAIFGLGLLSAAAGAKPRADRQGNAAGCRCCRLWGASILDDRIRSLSHGDGVRRRYGAGGARLEAAHGFPASMGSACLPCGEASSSCRAIRGGRRVNLLCAHRLRRRHQPAAPGRPGRSSLRPLRGAGFLRRWRRGPARLARARPAGA
jgi:hypothetical protein